MHGPSIAARATRPTSPSKHSANMFAAGGGLPRAGASSNGGWKCRPKWAARKYSGPGIECRWVSLRSTHPMVSCNVAEKFTCSGESMNWDSTVDVLVVGSGNGGMTAAVCCHEMGAKNVLVIEKGEKYGGTSSYSGGGIWVPCSHYTKEAGAVDSLEEAREYVKHAIPEGLVDPAMLDAYIQNGPEMLRFMHDRTRVRYESLEHYPDYYSDLPGAKNGHRSHEPEPVDMTLLGDEAQHLMPVHPMMRFLGRIGITQVEAALLYVQAPGWKSMIAKMMLAYVTDIPQRFKTKIHRRLTCGSAGVARLRLSMMDRNIPLWRKTRM